MRRFTLAILALFSCLTSVYSQTLLIDPAGDGGFQNGSTFAANGWTVVNSTGSTTPSNFWTVGTGASAYSSPSAYITTGTAGANTYNVNNISVVSFYRDVVLPAGQPNVILSFKWVSNGENTWDFWQVYVSPTSFTPTASTSTNSGAPATANYYSGSATLLGGGQLQTTVQTASYCIPPSVAGNSSAANTVRLIFVWRNDASGGSQPPAAIDDISLTSASLATPPLAVTSLSLSGATYNSFSGSWTANPSATDGYLTVVAPAGSTGIAPVQGVTYTVGSSIGAGKVVAVGAATNFTATGLNASTAYDVYVFPYYNNPPCATPGYLLGSANGAITTSGCTNVAPGTYSVGPTGTYPSLTAAANAVSGGVGAGNVVFELQPTYNSSVETYPILFSETVCPVNGNVTIRPAAGATNLSVSGSNTTALIDINGFKNLTIDGRAGGTGSAINLNIINTAATGTTIRLINDSKNNTITYCDVQGQSATSVPNPTGTTQAGVIYFGAANATTLQGNDNNTISFCNLHASTGGNPTAIILSSGSSSTDASYNDNNIITGNNIYDYFSAANASMGVKLDAGSNAWTISNNSFYQTATRTYTANNSHRAIWVTPGTSSTTTANGFIITGNKIGGTAPNAGGTALTMAGSVQNSFWGMDISVGLGTATSIQNNIIKNIDVTTTSTTNGFVGISQNQGNVNMGTVTGNVIGDPTTTGSILVTNVSSGGGTVVGYRILGGTSSVVNIQNNTFAGVTANATGTLGHSINAIVNSATSNGVIATINNNIIGSLTVANSVNAPNAATTNAQSVIGINVTASGTSIQTTINGNTIANLNNGYTSTNSSGLTAGIIVGTSSSMTLNSVNNNLISNLSSASTSTNTGASSVLLGISLNNTASAGMTVTGNTIRGLRLTTAAGTFASIQITGMFIAGSSSATNTFSNNYIHSFDVVNAVADTSIVMTGIDFSGATATFANNMIRLGVQTDGTSVTTGLTVRGISSNSGSSTNNFYFNTIYIGGTNVQQTTAKKTYAFIRTANNGTYDVRNNIFVNARSNGTNTGSHYAIYLTGANTGFSPDYNVYRYTGTGGVFAFNGTADVPAYTSGWIGTDTHSSVLDPMLANPTGNMTAVDLHLTQGSSAEGNGTPIASITTDFDGDVRANFTPTDIGADAGNYAPPGIDLGVISLDAPAAIACQNGAATVSVTLKNFSSSTINFATSPATITVTGTGPNAYSGTITLNTGTLASGTTQSVTLPTAANLSSNGTYVFNATVTVAADINAANNAIAPANVVVNSIGGTYTVGSGGNFPTLTAAVNAWNTAGCITAPVIFSLTDASYGTSETFPIVINSPAAQGANTLTIRPAAGIATTISGTSGTSAAALIKLNATRNVIIDGLNTGGASMAINNTSTSSGATVLWINSNGAGQGSAQNILRNLNIRGGVDQSTTATTNFGIVLGGALNTSATSITAGDDNDSNQVVNNIIRKVRYAIVSRGGSAANLNSGNKFNGNTIGATSFGVDEIGKSGILIREETNVEVMNNEIRFIGGDYATSTATGTDRAGISIATDASWTPTSATVTNAKIMSNNIHDIIDERTFSAVGIIYNPVATAATGNIIANNMISNVRANGVSGDLFAGIGIASANGDQFVYNTINISGDTDPNSASSTPSTGGYGVLITSTSATNISFKNNIISLDIYSSNAPAFKFSAIGVVSGLTLPANSSNKNVIWVNPSRSNLAIAQTSGTGGPFYATLAAWQTASAQDANSLSIQPAFYSISNAHLLPGLNNAIENTALPVSGVTTDIDGDARSATTPDPGADEVVTPPNCNSVVGGTLGGINTTKCALDSATLSANGFTTGNGTTYQWQSSTDNINFVDITGANNPTSYYTGALTTTRWYRLKVTCASQTGIAYSDTARVGIVVKPTYTLTPAPGVAGLCSASSQVLTLSNIAPATTTIQWLFFNQPITGATNATFTPTTGGQYRAIVLNPALAGCGDTTAVLDLMLYTSPTAITTTPAAPMVCSASPTAVQLTAAAGNVTNTYYFGTKANTNTASTTSAGYPAPYTMYYGGQRMQTLVLASELTAAGMIAGSPINSISFPVLSRGSNWPTTTTALQNFRVKAGLTSQATLTAFIPALSTVSGPASYTPQIGYNNTHSFGTPLIWDGVSNLVIETNFSNNIGGVTNDLVTQWNSPTSFQSTLVYRADGITATTADTTTAFNFSYNARPDFFITTITPGVFTWSPTTNLYTNSAGTIVYTGGPATTVYARPTTATTYTVTSTSNTGCTSTKTIAVGITPAPVITTQPANQTVCVGNTVTFSVVANNASGYQWQLGGVNIAGATSATYTISNVTSAQLGNYTVVITGGSGCGTITSNAAVLAFNAANNWTGTVSSDWNTPANWCGAVPTATDDITIPAGTPNQPNLNGIGNVRNLTIATGAQVTIGNQGLLHIYGNFTNNGTLLAATGSIEFNGTAAQTTSGMTVGNLILNGAGGVTPSASITATNTVTFTNGKLTLGNNNLNVNSIAGGSSSSYAVTNGTGAVTVNNVSTMLFPVGPTATSYNPVRIANGQTFNYNVRVATGLSPAVNNAANAVNRTWNITSTGTAITPVNITFQYADADMNASGVATNAMEVGVHNGSIWQIVSPAGGVTPTGTSTARQVTTGTFKFGPMAVGNITAISIATAVGNVDPDITNVQLMPNIVNDQALLRVVTRRSGMMNWVIRDGNGRVVMQFAKVNTAGLNDITLHLDKLAGGAYYLTGSSDKGKTEVIRFIKQ